MDENKFRTRLSELDIKDILFLQQIYEKLFWYFARSNINRSNIVLFRIVQICRMLQKSRNNKLLRMHYSNCTKIFKLVNCSTEQTLIFVQIVT